MRHINPSRSFLLALLASTPCVAFAQSVPQPIQYGWYPGLDLCLDSCFGSCEVATGYDACLLANEAAFGTCDAGCDVTCFFAPDSAACSDCRNACAAERAAANESCRNAFEECHQSCAQTCIPQYTNSVGTPWFCGDEYSDIQFGTLDAPYADLYQVVPEWDANPKTIYIASGVSYATPTHGGPMTINSPTWIINNTPGNGPVFITP